MPVISSGVFHYRDHANRMRCMRSLCSSPFEISSGKIKDKGKDLIGGGGAVVMIFYFPDCY
jgi:hypothetical protein